jgi:hypothetical protein
MHWAGKLGFKSGGLLKKMKSELLPHEAKAFTGWDSI